MSGFSKSNNIPEFYKMKHDKHKMVKFPTINDIFDPSELPKAFSEFPDLPSNEHYARRVGNKDY